MKVDPKVSSSVKSGKVMAGKASLRLDAPVKDGKVNPMKDIPGHKWERGFEPARIEKNQAGKQLEAGGFNKVEQAFHANFCDPGHMQKDQKKAMKGRGY